MTWAVPATTEPTARPATIARGRTADPPWVRPALLALLVGTALLYLVGLSGSGWANSFYSAAVQAGSTSWKAFFYGSSDAANSITVDKPPASLWLMALSVRIFGLHSWSILAPQAVEGVAAVGVLYATVRRWFSPGAALLSGAVLALTPVATLMFRFNNPDALLVLLLVLSDYAMVRAMETASTRWLVLAAACIGCGFLTKMLQAFLVVPAFALVYLIAAPVPWWRRVRQLLVAGLALIVSAGWWVAVVELVPARDRPYIGGSQHNSVLDLIFGYNGFGRITGNETGSVGGGGGPGGGWGQTGWSRLFGAEMGGQISWLLPAALAFFVVLLWLGRRAPRTDRVRAAVLLWGGWLLVTGVVFSFMQGIIHPYYTVALAPAIAALVGMGAGELWRLHRNPSAMLVLGGITAGSAVWSYILLDRSPQWNPWLRVGVLVAGISAAFLLVFSSWVGRRFAVAVASLALVAVLAGPTAYSIQTATTAHTGAIPSAGPAVTNAGFGRGPGGFGQGGRGGVGGGFGPGGFGPGGTSQNGTGQNGGGLNGTNQNGTTQNGIGQNGTGQNGTGQGGTGQGGSASGQAPSTGSQTPQGGGFPGRSGMGGLLDSSAPSAALLKALKQNAHSYTWVAATIGANNAAGYQLATQLSVMPIGGFNGTDPSPTLAQFEKYVEEGKIHYFIASGGMGMGGNGGNGTSAAITSWVTSHYTARTIGGVTVYDLTKAAS